LLPLGFMRHFVVRRLSTRCLKLNICCARSLNGRSSGSNASRIRLAGNSRPAVDYIDSAGLGALVSIYMHARRAGCDLEIANPKQRIRDLFSRSRLSSVFEGHEDLLGMTPD